MKEIMAFIRVNKVDETRKALELNGFYAYTCRKCLGRGKNMLSSAGKNLFLATDAVEPDPTSGGLRENRRLIAKRLFLVMVKDEDLSRAVNIIIEANQTGNAGDGKIFVSNVDESYIVRTGEKQMMD